MFHLYRVTWIENGTSLKEGYVRAINQKNCQKILHAVKELNEGFKIVHVAPVDPRDFDFSKERINLEISDILQKT